MRLRRELSRTLSRTVRSGLSARIAPFDYARRRLWVTERCGSRAPCSAQDASITNFEYTQRPATRSGLCAACGPSIAAASRWVRSSIELPSSSSQSIRDRRRAHTGPVFCQDGGPAGRLRARRLPASVFCGSPRSKEQKISGYSIGPDRGTAGRMPSATAMHAELLVDVGSIAFHGLVRRFRGRP